MTCQHSTCRYELVQYESELYTVWYWSNDSQPNLFYIKEKKQNKLIVHKEHVDHNAELDYDMKVAGDTNGVEVEKKKE